LTTGFAGEGVFSKGNEVVAAINKYKADMKSVLGTDVKYASIVKEVESKFDLSDVKNKGLSDKYLSYHFKGFPAIASVAKLSTWQNDINKAESDVYSSALGKAAVAAASYSNYKAIVLDKKRLFSGRTSNGKVVLGADENTVPISVTGAKLDPATKAKIAITAGGVGEQNFGGQFTFVEDGKTIPLKFEGKYVVVPRPNAATISADKMRYIEVLLTQCLFLLLVFLTMMFLLLPGLTKVGNGKYNMSPGGGTEVVISVSGKMSDGKVATDKKVYRIKGIPGPTGTIRGETGVVKGPKSNLEIATIGAKLEDFDFEVGLNVVGLI
jgi:gliding motility-associated protein GldM